MGEKFSGVYVSFQELVLSAKAECQKNIDSLIKLGFDSQKSKFSCEANYEKMVLRAKFSEDFMKVLREVSEHGDIRKIINIFKKAYPEKSNVILRVHKREIVTIGEQGPSLMIFLVNRACKKIRALLTKENKELRQLKKDIKASFRKIKCCKNVSVKVYKKTYKKIGKQVITAQIKIAVDEKAHMSLKKEKQIILPKKISFTYLNASRVISEVNKYIQAFI